MQDSYEALKDWRDYKQIDLSFEATDRSDAFTNHRNRTLAVWALFELLAQLIYKEKF